MVETDKGNSFLYNPKNKWSCPSCTYLNWPKAMKCTQCQRRRSTSPTSEEGTRVKTCVKDRHLTQKDDLIHHRKGNERPYGLIPSSNPWTTSPPPLLTRESISTNNNSGDTTYSPSDSFYNDRNHLQQQGQQTTGQTQVIPKSRPDQQMLMNLKAPSTREVGSATASSLPSSPLPSNTTKWTCQICTFENWPRALKCSMCYTNKPGPPLDLTGPPLDSTRQLIDSLDTISLNDDGSGGKAEASGGLDSSSLVQEVPSGETKSGFTSDSETEEK